MENLHQVSDLSPLSRIAPHLARYVNTVHAAAVRKFYGYGFGRVWDWQNAGVHTTTQCCVPASRTLTIISSRAMCGTSVRLVIFATKMTLYTCQYR
jgi:hypothetical protein